MPKLILEFETQEELDYWLGVYGDGGAESEMIEAFMEEGLEYPEIKVTKEQ